MVNVGKYTIHGSYGPWYTQSKARTSAVGRAWLNIYRQVLNEKMKPLSATELKPILKQICQSAGDTSTQLWLGFVVDHVWSMQMIVTRGHWSKLR